MSPCPPAGRAGRTRRSPTTRRWTAGRECAYNRKVLRCLLVAALAAPPAPSAGSPPPSASAPSPSASATSPSASAPSRPSSSLPGGPSALARVAADPRATGTLELSATRVDGGPVVVRDAMGEVVATLQLRPDTRARLELPPGTYSVDDSARGGRIGLSVDAGQTSRLELTPEGARGGAGEDPRVRAPARAGASDVSAPGDPSRPRWKKVAAPIFSAMVPGVGQMVNRQPGKGLGLLLGAIALGIGSAVLMGTGGGTDVSSPHLNSTSFGTEAIGAVGYGLLSGGLQMLYAAQIMDAYATAAGSRGPRPRVRHRVSLELTRMATVGLRPGDPAAGFFPDWSLSLLGQVARRLSVGVGDLAIKQGHGFTRTTLQGGVRLHYRFLERERIWLGAAAGVILQGSFGRAAHSDVADAALDERQGSFAAIPYAQMDVRFFILDRWSLNLTPRVSAPLAGPRFYNGPGDRAVPQRAATLELGTGVGVYF